MRGLPSVDCHLTAVEVKRCLSVRSFSIYPQWDFQFKNEFRAYLEQHAQDFVSTDTSQSYNCPLTLQELHLTLENLKSTCPGSDGLSPWFFKECGEITRTCLLRFFNASLASGRLPKAFKCADLIPIPKPGRDLSHAKGYRPISLILVISRILESIMHRRAYYWAESCNQLPPTQ